MHLDNLKAAWQQFRLLNSMQSMDQGEILLILENAERMSTKQSGRLLMHSVLFIVITLCCQGG
jgi:hypothetical protein